MNKEDEILLDGIERKISQYLVHGQLTNTNFLDVHQRQLSESVCRRNKDLEYMFYGGYQDAERTIAVFMQDPAELEDNNPLAILRVTIDSFNELAHRDYLGSLVGIGIKREMIGDILVRKDGADIIILKSIAQFLKIHYSKAGNVNLDVEIHPMSSLIIPEERFEMKRDTVASLRLDGVLASAFSIARSTAVEAVNSGIVFINSQQCVKCDRIVKEGDRLTLRGKGKIILDTVGNTTKKGRTIIVVKKYI